MTSGPGTLLYGFLPGRSLTYKAPKFSYQVIFKIKRNLIPVKPLDRAIFNIKYPLGKEYVRMGLTPLPKVRVCRDFSNPSSSLRTIT